MTSISILDDLFPESSSEIVQVSTGGGTTTYTLLTDLLIYEDNLTPAIVPNDVDNVIFNGDSHTVKYVKANGNVTTSITTNGLFSTQVINSVGPSYDITIENIGVKGGTTNQGKGFICNSNFAKKASSSITISNCHSSGNVSGDDSGGITGNQFGHEANSDSKLYVLNCYSSGNISGLYSGGIVGSDFGLKLNGTVTISECYSSGQISGLYSGGIVGSDFGLKLNGTVTISECYSSGQISGSRAGGIIGYQFGHQAKSGSKLYVEKCYSTGLISAQLGGGIAGAHVGVGTESGCEIRFDSCYSTGDITAYHSDNGGGLMGSYFAGGVSGYQYSMQQSMSTDVTLQEVQVILLVDFLEVCFVIIVEARFTLIIVIKQVN